MKKLLFFSLFSSVLFLASCGGWSDDRQSQVKNTCLGSGMYDCDCYLDKVMKAYPAPDDFNGLSEDQKKEVVKDCVQESKGEEENLESF